MLKPGFSPKENDGGGFSFAVLAKSTGVCYAATIALIAVFAVIVTCMPISESVVPAVVLTITVVSIIVSGFMVAKKARSNGWLCGAASGVTYIISLYLIGSLVFQSFTFGVEIIMMIIIGALAGAFGGIIGVNSKR